RVVLRRGDVHAQIPFGVLFSRPLDVGGAGGRDDGLAFEIVERFDVRLFLRDVAVGGHEVRSGEPYLLLALEVVGGRTAFEVDGAVRHQRDARGGGHRIALCVDLFD